MSNWFSRVPRPFNGGKRDFSTNSAGTIQYPHKNKWFWTSFSHCIWKLTQNRALNINAKTIKILKGNMGVNLCDLGLDKSS